MDFEKIRLKLEVLLIIKVIDICMINMNLLTNGEVNGGGRFGSIECAAQT